MSEKAKWLQVGIEEAYHNTSIKEFKGDPQAGKEIEKYILNIPEMRVEGLGLMLWGANGVGKTMLGVETLKAALRLTNPRTRQPFTCYMTSLSEIVSTFTAGWTSLDKRIEFHNKILRTDFLLIDDAEKVYMPKDSNNVVIAATDQTLRKRINSLRPVIITSNEPPGELGKIFGPSIGSLLAGWVIPIKFEGTDFRKEHHAVSRWKEYYPKTSAGKL